MWGEETNHRGEKLEEFILTNNLTVQNTGRPPTFSARGTETAIDVTLTLNVNNLKNWIVTDETTFSDHYAIRFGLSFTKPKNELLPNLEKTDWTQFRHITEIETPTPTLISPQWIETETNSLTKLINKALRSTSPLISVNSQPKRCLLYTSPSPRDRG